MTEQPSNVLEIIQQSMELPEIGHGQEATVYPLAGLPDYVLRVRDDADHRLHTTTQLTPVNYGFDHHAIAPPLVQGEGFSIHPRQPGKSLTLYWQDLARSNQTNEGMEKPEADTKAYEKIMQLLANLPQEQYQVFLEDMNFLTTLRRGIEPLGDNIMLSDATMRWVDPGHNPLNNHLGNVEKMLFQFDLNSAGHKTTEIKALQEQISTKLQEAARLTHTPMNEAEVAKMIPKHHKFEIKHAISEISLLPLSATPVALRETLNRVENHIRREF